MARQFQYFTVERLVNAGTPLAESVEYDLQAECEVNDEVAYIDGPVLVLNDDGERVPWNGTLTEEEESQVAEDAHEFFLHSGGDADFDDEALLDSEYDNFRDDRAISLGSRGKVYY
jgi:hypothetical protein